MFKNPFFENKGPVPLKLIFDICNLTSNINDKKIKGKYGGLWDKSVISTIIKRETKQEE